MEIEKQLEINQSVIADLRDKLQNCYQRDLEKTGLIATLECENKRFFTAIIYLLAAGEFDNLQNVMHRLRFEFGFNI